MQGVGNSNLGFSQDVLHEATSMAFRMKGLYILLQLAISLER